MSVNSKMTAIADAIRAKTGSTDALTLDGMAAAIPNVYAAGEAAEAARIAAKQFVSTTYGNDENTISVAIPFAPDFICISCYEAYSRAAASTYCGALCDFRSAALTPVALIQYVNSGGKSSNANASYSTAKTIFTYADGTFTFVPPASTEFQNSKWKSELLYVVSAFKYTDQSDKELITDQIARLPDSGGTIEFASAAIHAVFTDDEWAELIAIQPNWTFTLS